MTDKPVDEPTREELLLTVDTWRRKALMAERQQVALQQTVLHLRALIGLAAVHRMAHLATCSNLLTPPACNCGADRITEALLNEQN